ncbi:hypothetical protein OBBRIDRAFT_34457 [Obba rivulosa]|uniref:Uncharacterized protein n=1 Tax=Obba rivulosa TaxID=1052685 RepID=A0A8E2AQS9_9APHY|nr:hypothetical protein OBBRIDRAFT_34457 [Obba rivulosa]
MPLRVLLPARQHQSRPSTLPQAPRVRRAHTYISFADRNSTKCFCALSSADARRSSYRLRRPSPSVVHLPGACSSAKPCEFVLIGTYSEPSQGESSSIPRMASLAHPTTVARQPRSRRDTAPASNSSPLAESSQSCAAGIRLLPASNAQPSHGGLMVSGRRSRLFCCPRKDVSRPGLGGSRWVAWRQALLVRDQAARLVVPGESPQES